MLAKPENAGKFLRVYVEQGGCSGMQYGMMFDEKRDGDLTSEQDGISVLVDAFSAKYVRSARRGLQRRADRRRLQDFQSKRAPKLWLRQIL